jgi:hypothetical protein
MDADEFLSHFWDKLENELKEVDQGELVKETFGGTLEIQIISEECNHQSISSEDYLILRLDIKRMKNIDEA